MIDADGSQRRVTAHEGELGPFGPWTAMLMSRENRVLRLWRAFLARRERLAAAHRDGPPSWVVPGDISGWSFLCRRPEDG